MKLDSSQTGLNRAMRKLSVTAHRTASHGTKQADPKDNYVDLTVDRITAKRAFQANLAVRKTEDEVASSLLDIFA